MSTSTVPMFSPDGILGDIPYEKMQAARQAGGMPAVQVKSPEGESGWIPANRMQDAVKAGGQVVPIEQQEAQHPGFWHAVAEDSLGMLKGAAPLLGGPPAIAVQGIQQALAERKSVAETGKTPQQIQSEGQAQAGYGPAYRYLATPAAQAVGVNVPGMEQSAAQGDVGGVLGHTVVPAAAAIAPVAGAEVLKGAHAAISSTERAGQGLAAMDKAYVDLPIAATRSYGFFNELASKLERTGLNVPGPIKAFIQRNAVADIASAHPEVAAQLQEQGIPTHSPLTFPEAREFRTALNSLKFDQQYSALREQIGYGAGLLDQDIRASAPHPEFLKDYNRFNKEYYRAKGAQRIADQVGPVIGGTAGGLIGRSIGGLPGMAEGAMIGGMAGKAAGKPVIGGLVRAITERPTGAPDLTPPKLPTSRLPRDAYTRIMLDAKEGNISPTRLDQMGIPKMRRMPQEPSEPPQPPEGAATTTAAAGFPRNAEVLNWNPTKMADPTQAHAAIQDFYKPGNVVWNSYFKNYDKVLDFKRAGNQWEVTVIRSDKNGTPLAGERPRTHATVPDRGDQALRVPAMRRIPQPPEEP